MCIRDRVCADHAVARSHQALFGKEGVLDSHITDIKVIFDVVLLCKGAALLALLRCLDILIRCKVIHYQGNFILVEDLVKSCFVKFIDGDRGGDIISQNQIQLRLKDVYKRQSRNCADC